jgi:hypothetical protein
MIIDRFGDYKEPNIGDYVICSDNEDFLSADDNVTSKNINYYLEVNVGKIIAKNEFGFDYIVGYNNIPKDISNYFLHFGYKNSRGFNSNEIVKFSKDRIELELSLSTKKYNI